MQLRIRGFAIVDEVTIDFGQKMNVLTGETGAGKSIVVDAVNLLRGGRAGAEWIRAGEEEARVEAIFDLGPPDGELARSVSERLADAGIDPQPDGLLVRRIIGRSGRGKVVINGSLANAATLATVIAPLIDVAGQHEQQGLSDVARHTDLLDSFAGLESRRRGLAADVAELRSAMAELAELSDRDRNRGEREEWIRFQLREIDEAKLEPNEDARLGEERERLRHAGRLGEVTRRAADELYADDGSVVERLGKWVRELEGAAQLDSALASVVPVLRDALVGAEEAAETLRRYADTVEENPDRLEQIESRLALIGKLIRKHANGPTGSLADVLVRHQEMAAEIDQLDRSGERRSSLEERLTKLKNSAFSTAKELSRARAAAAKKLGSAVGEKLVKLGMAGAEFVVSLSPRVAKEDDASALVQEGARLTESGIDRVEFLISANRGEPPKPLTKVASGGELSRVMLALKRALARNDAVTTYLFDEVDAGIGGAIAEVVGRELKEVAALGQVICITHLGQIAAFADSHFFVSKGEKEGRTATSVRKLTESDRVEEVARMLGGVVITDATRAHAREMVKGARPKTRAERRE